MAASRKSNFVALSLLAAVAVEAFLPRHGVSNSFGLTASSSSSSALFYTDDPPSQDNARRGSHGVMTIPVLGPIPGGAPLMIGEDFLLEEPTSMQWKTLEEAVYNHRNYLQEQSVTGIEAAPLVAFMDEITSMYAIPGDRKNSKYATIAAVVGISSSSSKSSSSSQEQLGLDTSSSTSFMESIMRVFQPDNTMIRPSESKIRLVGIGRAALSDFHSRLPSSHYEEQHDKDGYLMLDEKNNNDHDNSADTTTQEASPIVLAQFRLLSDSGERSDAFVNHYGRSRNASPIHALTEMSNLASRITSLHEDRKRLVRGLQAAKARLSVAAQNDAMLEDHDGLGMLPSGFQLGTDTTTNSATTTNEAEQEQHEIDSLLAEFPGGDNDPLHRHSYLTSSSKATANSHSRLLEMENYGMGISSASFAAIPGLTTALAEKLQPYYSPEKHDTEEHYYEVFSFMGVHSLSRFVKVHDLDWALKCTNTIERMQWVYEWMWSHKKLLQDASEEVSAELRDCGEECTDLW